MSSTTETCTAGTSSSSGGTGTSAYAGYGMEEEGTDARIFFLASLTFAEFRIAAGLCAVHYPGWAGGQPHGLPENQQSRTKVWLPPLSTREAALRPYDDYPCVCEVVIVRPRPGDNARFVSLPHPSRVIGVLWHAGGSNAPADGVGGIHSRQPLEIFIF